MPGLPSRVTSSAPPSKVVPDTLYDDRRTHDEKRAHLEASLHGLSDDLREVEERLKRKGELGLPRSSRRLIASCSS